MPPALRAEVYEALRALWKDNPKATDGWIKTELERRYGFLASLTPIRNVRAEIYGATPRPRGAVKGSGRGGRPKGVKDSRQRAIRSDKRALIMQLLAEGKLSQMEIAKQVGTTKQYVSRIAAHMPTDGSDGQLKN